MLFGDSTSAPVDEGSTAKAIVGGSTLGQRKTLFQDIFGASAFADLSNVPSTVGSVSTPAASALPWNGNDVTGLLDTPAYLMPPIESLFEPLMDSFLKPRPKEKERDDTPNTKPQDEDVEMADQSRDGDFLVTETRQERVVDQDEMDAFIKLFKSQTKCMSVPCSNFCMN